MEAAGGISDIVINDILVPFSGEPTPRRVMVQTILSTIVAQLDILDHNSVLVGENELISDIYAIIASFRIRKKRKRDDKLSPTSSEAVRTLLDLKQNHPELYRAKKRRSLKIFEKSTKGAAWKRAVETLLVQTIEKTEGARKTWDEDYLADLADSPAPGPYSLRSRTKAEALRSSVRARNSALARLRSSVRARNSAARARENAPALPPVTIRENTPARPSSVTTRDSAAPAPPFTREEDEKIVFLLSMAVANGNVAEVFNMDLNQRTARDIEMRWRVIRASAIFGDMQVGYQMTDSEREVIRKLSSELNGALKRKIE